MKAQLRRASPGRLVAFPSRTVLDGVRALDDDIGPEVDEVAATVLVVAIKKGEPIPPGHWLVSIIVRNVGRPLAPRLVGELSRLVEVLVGAYYLAEYRDVRLSAVGGQVVNELECAFRDDFG